jgi:hypothetical protein
MLAILHNSPSSQHYYAICMAYRGKSVGYYNNGTVLRQRLKSGLDLLLRLRVKMARGFVKNEYRRILYNSPGY